MLTLMEKKVVSSVLTSQDDCLKWFFMFLEKIIYATESPLSLKPQREEPLRLRQQHI